MYVLLLMRVWKCHKIEYITKIVFSIVWTIFQQLFNSAFNIQSNWKFSFEMKFIIQRTVEWFIFYIFNDTHRFKKKKLQLQNSKHNGHVAFSSASITSFIQEQWGGLLFVEKIVVKGIKSIVHQSLVGLVLEIWYLYFARKGKSIAFISHTGLDMHKPERGRYHLRASRADAKFA